jgi:TonB family protein
MKMARLATSIVLCLALPLFSSAQGAATERDADVSPVRFVSDIKRPTKVVKPTYPESAKLAGLQGPVVLDIVIGESGAVEMAHAITGPKEFWSAAAEAVKQWKWEPILLNQKPIRVRTKVTVKFVLDASRSRKPKVDSY